MKKLTVWMVACIVLTLGWSCEEKDNMDPLGNWDLDAPTPEAPAPDAAVVLDESAPDSTVTFEWSPATTSNRFGIDYTFLLVPEGSDDYENAIMRVAAARGEDLSVSLSAAEIDYALWAACYPAGATVDLQWVVVAKAIEKEASASQEISVTRFETEYKPNTLFIYGEGTEAGGDPSGATPMRAHTDQDGNYTGVFDVYTTLTPGGTFYLRDRAVATSRLYGGADGILEPCATTGIATPETGGQYRVTVDLNNNTYAFLHIDRWSLVGDAVEGGWGGDVPLAYKGAGIWEGEIEFLSEAGFVFRANGDWGYLLKRIKGTATANNKGGDLVMESEAAASGDEFEDIPGTLGPHTVTLNLAADGYTYSLVEVRQEAPEEIVIGETDAPDRDAVAASITIPAIATPDAVFLMADGDVVAEFTKNGDVFSSEKYLALEAGKTYSLRTAGDDSGDAILEDDIAVARDQAYTMSIDFANSKLSWKYYNMKLFHWNDAGGWEERDEFVMTYVHPYTFEVTADLIGGYDVKFNSPWEVQFGTSATSLTGTMNNVLVDGPNFKGIKQSARYLARIVVAEDYMTAEYSFEKQ